MHGLHHVKKLSFAAALMLSAALTPAHAEVRQVDGRSWKESTVEQKQAYLVGILNVLSVNQAVQTRKGTIDEQAPLTRYLRATDTQSVRNIQDRLDGWYAANPDKLSTPVLGVIWLGLVRAGA